MSKIERYPLSFIIAINCCFSAAIAQPNTQAYCDSIIKTGVDSMLHRHYSKALNLLTEAQTLAAGKHWYKQQFLAINNIGLVNYFLYDYGEAQKYYLEAYTIAVKEADRTLQMTVLNNIAILYSKEKNFGQAYSYFKKAYDMAKEDHQNLRIGNYAHNLGIVCNETNETAKGKQYLEEALQYLQGNTQRLLEANTTLAENHILQGNTKDAIAMGEKLLKQARDSSYKEDETAVLTMLAKAYSKNGDFAKAAQYAKDALPTSPGIDETISIYTLLSGIENKAKDYELALRYKDSVMVLQDSADKIKNTRLFENSKIKFELLNSQHELSLNQAQLANERKVFYAILALVLVVIVFIIWALRNRTKEYKQKKLMAERSQKITELEFEKEKSEHLLLEKQLQEKETSALLEQERLKNEIEVRNRKLSAKALYLSGRNELIEEIITSLAKTPGIADDGRLASQIVNLKSHLKANNEWDNFSGHFEEVNQGFLSALKIRHPSLNVNDIRFLSYVYMGLNTKEIASALNITPEGCRKRRERLLKKMELPEDITLYNYLSSL